MYILARLQNTWPTYLHLIIKIRVATIVIYLVLQSIPTHVNGWAGYSAITPIFLYFCLMLVFIVISSLIFMLPCLYLLLLLFL